MSLGKPHTQPRNSAIVPRLFFKERKALMESKREFYPMITQTVKTLIQVSDREDETWILITLKNYPDVEIEDEYKSPLIIALLAELDRQYARWKRGNK